MVARAPAICAILYRLTVPTVKNIQVIDGAANCTFSIFHATDAEFALIFAGPGQDIEFAEDLSREALDILELVWRRPIRKQDAQGIHGTLFYQFGDRRAYFPASKRERDWSASSLNEAQRRLYREQP